MKSWKSYKKTFRDQPDIFDYARQGDLRGLANLFTEQPSIDLNAKNHRGYSALMLAVYNGQDDFCEALLRCGADVNSTDSVGNTLLMSAAFKGNLTLLKLLLQYDASVTLENRSKMTVKDWAVMFKRSEIISYLDQHYGNQNRSSKFHSIIKFIRLALILCKTKLSPQAA
ncbi:hypothetical protein GCM10007916_31220 [Psychromonas marina]|uniref:Ankyrin repeat domain-containing protein n=1 Tax=Psychromonas marina TaxID=88364 RepID=A0ABQ6E3X1_9GAMM|nr:ankyrin repeat domain-containing protein [Psychromonas marina]GLS92052.1 hypothetical protein GCM10007916_31220 [Psychromonas marina]